MDETELLRIAIDRPQARRDLRAEVLVEACLERIGRCQPRLNAFITLTPDLARADARHADQRSDDGQELALHGLLLAVKDNIDVAGIPTTNGTKAFPPGVPDRDARVVGRLRSAGAVVLGKTNMHELAFGVTNDNPFFGTCRNPWDLDRIPGGSSGGSGVAVAADLCVGALGTDTGGSVRIPAALTGVSGLRPTYGCVSNRGTFASAWSFDTVGPMARSVEDLSRMFAVMSGYDEGDPRAISAPMPAGEHGCTRQIDGVRIGLAIDSAYELDPELDGSVRRMADVLSDLGADVRTIRVAGTEEAAAIFTGISRSEVLALHHLVYERDPAAFGDDTRRRLALGELVTGSAYAALLQRAYEWRAMLRRTFLEIDVLLTPTTPSAAPLIAAVETVATSAELTKLTCPWSVAHLPSLSIPCGVTRSGLPIGAQLTASWWQEPLLLTMGAAYQARTDWHLRRPPVS